MTDDRQHVEDAPATRGRDVSAKRPVDVVPDPSAARATAAISQRKREHVDVALHLSDVPQAGWDDIHLVHHSLPEVDFDDVSLRTPFLGHVLSMPLVIAGMTGAHADAVRLNSTLARAAERDGIAIGVGSQRAALLHPELMDSFAVVRSEAPNAFVIANIGISQLLAQPEGAPVDADDVQAILDMIRADALAVHLNFLEEVVQPEGQRRARGCLDAISSLVDTCSVPVIAKETGSGLSRRAAEMLKGAGVAALDVGGLGGTSFLRIESTRAALHGDERRVALGAPFEGWGIPTAVSVAQCADVLPTIAVGGVRSGVDAAKALALGAVTVGVGRPLLERANEGDDALAAWLATFREQLRVAVFLSGGHGSGDLCRAQRVVIGETGRWIDQLPIPVGEGGWRDR